MYVRNGSIGPVGKLLNDSRGPSYASLAAPIQRQGTDFTLRNIQTPIALFNQAYIHWEVLLSVEEEVPGGTLLFMFVWMNKVISV